MQNYHTAQQTASNPTFEMLGVWIQQSRNAMRATDGGVCVFCSEKDNKQSSTWKDILPLRLSLILIQKSTGWQA
jgi:hypothetical protein